MEIEAKSRLDIRSLQAVNGLAISGKKEPKRKIKNTLILVACCAVFLLLSEMLMLATGDSLPPWIFIVMGVSVLFMLFPIYTYYIAPKRQYKKLGKQADMQSRYLFRETEMHVIVDGADGFHAEETIPYSMLHALKETTEYFFIYIDKLRIFPIDKLSMSATEIETVRGWLSTTLPYTLCHY